MAELPAWIRIEGEAIWLNTAMTARFFGVSRMTLSEWARRGAPKTARGWWPIRELNEWLGRSPGAGGEGAPSLEARKLAADAEYRELKAAREKVALAALADTLMHKDELADEWARRVNELKASLLSLARKVAGQFTDPDARSVVESVVTDEVYDYLEQYSRTGRYTAKTEAPKRQQAR